jgi:hypothetical protein
VLLIAPNLPKLQLFSRAICDVERGGVAQSPNCESDKNNAKKGALEDKSDGRHPRSLFFQTLRQAVAQADVARGTLNIEKCKN